MAIEAKTRDQYLTYGVRNALFSIQLALDNCEDGTTKDALIKAYDELLKAWEVVKD